MRTWTATASPGLNTDHWDGTDGAGRAVAGGVYLCEVTAEATTERIRLTLIR